MQTNPSNRAYPLPGEPGWEEFRRTNPELAARIESRPFPGGRGDTSGRPNPTTGNAFPSGFTAEDYLAKVKTGEYVMNPSDYSWLGGGNIYNMGAMEGAGRGGQLSMGTEYGRPEGQRPYGRPEGQRPYGRLQVESDEREKILNFMETYYKRPLSNTERNYFRNVPMSQLEPWRRLMSSPSGRGYDEQDARRKAMMTSGYY